MANGPDFGASSVPANEAISIQRCNLYNGLNGQISYFNWRLSADENDSSITSVKSTTPTNNIPIMADIVVGASLCSILIGFYIFKSYKKKQQNRDYRPEVTEESPGHEVTLNKI
ncbi:unnamed protein product [Rhizophagus irregularis]|nr:unnamed protein product [Rhizophagus irregularis]